MSWRCRCCCHCDFRFRAVSAFFPGSSCADFEVPQKGATQTATLSLSLLAFWQCQLSEICTEIQQMLHCAEPSSPRRESLTHLPFGSARAELKFMASFWVSGCRGQTCACTFPSRHNMWHIPRQAAGPYTCHAPPPWGNSHKRRKVVQLVDFRFFGQPFCCRVKFKQ